MYRLVSLLSLTWAILSAGMAAAQEYPAKPIRVVTTPAGGGSDFSVRYIGPVLTGSLGQPIVVDNRANGILAAQVVARAQPDGYTLLVGGDSTWITQLVQPTQYDARVDFSPITLMDKSPHVLAVHPSVPVKSVRELIALAKAQPGVLNYSSSSALTTSHLAAELFKLMSGADIVWVPYKGSAPATAAIVSGQVQVTFGSITPTTPHVKSGALRALAVSGGQPSALFPGLPTIAAAGLPGYEWEGITAALAPAKAPGAIVARLNQEFVRVLNRPEVKERFLSAGVETVGSTPGELAALINRNMASMEKVIKSAGIKLD